MKYLTIIGFCILSFNLAAQVGNINGIAINNEGKPVEWVSIQLKGTNKGTSTTEKGEFSITKIPAKRYILVASFVGYKTLEQNILIEPERTTQIILELKENSEQLKEIVVKAYINANEKVSEIGKLPIRAMDLPQSLSIIDRQMIDNQQIKNMAEVLANTNGMYIMGTTGGYQEEIAGRGFALNSTNTFRNGIRYFNGMMGDFSNVEKVEVLKGSAAILYGNVAAGGIINLVTKKPKFEFGGELAMKTGSFGQYKPYLDIYSGIGKSQKLAFRINGSYEQANSFRVGVSSKRYFVNPSILLKPSKKTEILIETSISSDDRTPDFGAGIINYEIIKLPREKFTGVAWSKFIAKQQATNISISQSLTESWKLNFNGGLRQYKTELFANTRPNSGTLITKEGMWIRNIQKTNIDDKYQLAQLDLTGKLNIGQTNHQLLVGIETDNIKTNTTIYNQIARYDTLNLFNKINYKTRTDIPNMTIATISNVPVSRFGVYFQNLITINNYVKILAGLRYSYQQTASTVKTLATNKSEILKYYDEAFSPRFGLVIQPTKSISVFGSYANSFNLNTGVDLEGKALKPSVTDQFEIGLKNQLLANKLSLNITTYKIINANLAQISLQNGNTNSNIKELAGTVASKGIEIDIMAKPISNLSIVAGYSYNETKYIKSNTFIEGSFLKYNPNHTANFSGNYLFTNGKISGLNLGIIGLYIGDRQAGRSTRIQIKDDAYKLVKIPAYTQMDATIGYTKKKITIGAKIGNIFDTYSYNVHDDNSVNPITPRNYTGSISYKF
jgi:iron complex outermembrane recepter protein